MSPEEMKKLALQASKQEYEQIIVEMQNAAKQGSFSCTFRDLSDGAIQQLKDAGYTVHQKTHIQRSAFGSTGIPYYEVSFGK